MPGKTNLHSHTKLCRHATAEVGELCAIAIRQGFTTFGFSDHAPYPDNHPSHERMNARDLPMYRFIIEGLRMDFPELFIPIGLELDYLPNAMESYRNKYCNDIRFDFLIGSVHQLYVNSKFVFFVQSELYDEDCMIAFIDGYIDMAMHCNFIDILAHPDIGAHHYRGGMTRKIERRFRELGKIARENNVSLELNANGLRKKHKRTTESPGYPWLEAWQIIASEKPPIVSGLDVHHVRDMTDGTYEENMSIAKSLSIVLANDRIIETIRRRANGNN